MNVVQLVEILTFRKRKAKLQHKVNKHGTELLNAEKEIATLRKKEGDLSLRQAFSAVEKARDEISAAKDAGLRHFSAT